MTREPVEEQFGIKGLELVDQTGVEPAKASPKGDAGLPDDRMGC
jgi:hypothetical protein